MLWITRDYVHVDRVACPWLIRRFIYSRAQFIFLPRDQKMDFVSKTGAIPFDTGTGIELDHYEEEDIEYCTFDAIIRKYNLTGDAALSELQKVVRAADTSGGLEREPLAWVLEVIASGMPLLCESDQECLEKEFPMYDGFYAYMQRKIVLKNYTDEVKTMKSHSERREFIKDKTQKLPSKML